MIIPELGLRRHIELCRYIEIYFIERLTYYQEDVEKSPKLQALGHAGKCEKLKKNAAQVMKMIDEMLEGEV